MIHDNLKLMMVKFCDLKTKPKLKTWVLLTKMKN